MTDQEIRDHLTLYRRQSKVYERDQIIADAHLIELYCAITGLEYLLESTVECRPCGGEECGKCDGGRVMKVLQVRQ